MLKALSPNTIKRDISINQEDQILQWKIKVLWIIKYYEMKL